MEERARYQVKMRHARHFVRTKQRNIKQNANKRIRPWKGGRTCRISARVTPECADKLAQVAKKLHITHADFIEVKIEEAWRDLFTDYLKRLDAREDARGMYHSLFRDEDEEVKDWSGHG